MTKNVTQFMAIVLAVGGLVFGGCVADVGSAEGAITHGSLDGEDHPAVVLILMEEDGAPAYRCSGTLISPTVVLTAGHCTGEPGEFSGMRVYTEADVETGDNNYPFAGPNAVEAASWHTHPEYTSAAFFLHDVGVINLSEAVEIDGDYGTLPDVDSLDAIRPRASSRFTAVGYGLQRVNPVMVEAERVRMNAHPHLIQINVPGMTGGFSMILSNNARTGGTCFGDSGGANFLGDSNVVAGVTSFGLNGTCGGTGGVFRTDRANVLDFIEDVRAD